MLNVGCEASQQGWSLVWTETQRHPGRNGSIMLGLGAPSASVSRSDKSQQVIHNVSGPPRQPTWILGSTSSSSYSSSDRVSLSSCSMAAAVKDGSHSRTKAAVPAADRRGVRTGARLPRPVTGRCFQRAVRLSWAGKGVIYREGSTDRTIPPSILRSGAAALSPPARRSVHTEPGADVTGAPLQTGNAPFARGCGGYGGQTGPNIDYVWPCLPTLPPASPPMDLFSLLLQNEAFCHFVHTDKYLFTVHKPCYFFF